VFSAVKRTVARGTADYADEKDAADEWKQHQRRTEGSQSVSSAV
jgi:Arc/MetJ family transcription regulator